MQAAGEEQAGVAYIATGASLYAVTLPKTGLEGPVQRGKEGVLIAAQVRAGETGKQVEGQCSLCREACRWRFGVGLMGRGQPGSE